jgi:hypothetical protein
MPYLPWYLPDACGRFCSTCTGSNKVMWLDTVVLVQQQVRGYWGPRSIVGQGECNSGAQDHRSAAGSFVAVYRAPERWEERHGRQNSDGENAKKNRKREMV